ncbi:hypothetical protein HAX54_035051 [Datura stramonium]|uniref:Uncharacterized protein n=1 Tax=Datura stramonium TaxID=4076 RepID=A0ABS8VHH4_DATST|nr:hypothetical protein [Datura stramonium]
MEMPNDAQKSADDLNCTMTSGEVLLESQDTQAVTTTPADTPTDTDEPTNDDHQLSKSSNLSESEHEQEMSTSEHNNEEDNDVQMVEEL